MGFFDTAAKIAGLPTPDEKRAEQAKRDATRKELRELLVRGIARIEREIADIDRILDPRRNYGYKEDRTEMLRQRAVLVDQLAYDKRELRDL